MSAADDRLEGDLLAYETAPAAQRRSEQRPSLGNASATRRRRRWERRAKRARRRAVRRELRRERKRSSVRTVQRDDNNNERQNEMAQSPTIPSSEFPASSASELYRRERARGLTPEQARAQAGHCFGYEMGDPYQVAELDRLLRRAQRPRPPAGEAK